jgi:hypothetical protein
MSSFNFIESSFLLSLGITFVLIVLLVYHFKQRLGAMEQKCDTMFDIVQNLVKEMNTVKKTVTYNPHDRAMTECAMAGCTMFNGYMPNQEDVNVYEIDEYEGEEDDEDEVEDDEDEDEDDDEDDDEDEDVKVINMNEIIKLDDIADIDVDSASEDGVVELQEIEPIQVSKIDVAPNYKKMTVAELRSLATNMGTVANPNKMSKTELIKVLEK